MEDLLHRFQLNPTTWVYLSSLLTVVVFFKFRRFLSIRNLDLAALIAYSPGLLMVSAGKALRTAGQTGSEMVTAAVANAPPLPLVEHQGYWWLLGVSSFFLVRLLCDPLLVRRPLLEPNVTAEALAFLGLVLFAFMMTNVATAKLPEALVSQAGVRADGRPPGGTAMPANGGGLANGRSAQKTAAVLPPRFWLLDQLPRIPSRAFGYESRGQGKSVHDVTARTLAILSHLAVILGLVFVGYRHFDNIWTGIATATLYLLLPYTAQLVGYVDHVVPAALFVWAIALYRQPLAAGIVLGTAIGMIPPYPAFLLPLWIGFYWQRGLLRFLCGVAGAVAVLTVASLIFSDNFGLWLVQIKNMFAMPEVPEGFWYTHAGYYRIPIVALFFVLCLGLAIWPAQKNLGTLISCSAAVMLFVQFWYAEGGLLYLNWYLPPLLLTVFRPNLENRIALTALRESRISRRRETPLAA